MKRFDCTVGDANTELEEARVRVEEVSGEILPDVEHHSSPQELPEGVPDDNRADPTVGLAETDKAPADDKVVDGGQGVSEGEGREEVGEEDLTDFRVVKKGGEEFARAPTPLIGGLAPLLTSGEGGKVLAFEPAESIGGRGASA